MSYCRSGRDSDVYVYSDEVKIVCCCGARDHFADTPQEMLLHLVSHMLRGDKVPLRAIRRLIHESIDETDITQL